MYLYGASGHSKVIIEILENLGVEINGLFDDNPEKQELLGYKVFAPENDFKTFKEELIISIGDNHLRKMISDKNQFNYGKAVHPSAIISNYSRIGLGTVIMGKAIINCDTTVGKHVIINTSASIDHDCIIDDFVHISPSATICGGVTIGEGSHIGASAVVIPGIHIGQWVKVGAGSVVIKNVPDFATVVGNPARIINIGV